ncbi:glutathionylspermidine synthase family protein [Nitrospirillum sp. BR 11828]|uniref:glutathionylspermidine synthase family protein n=1 Tax=Nitrospirillum sp. BR 11828 TaxID=3104325 RepID=UPI002ACAFF4F|nr:glutathionylspermidine synthase family protein [Nitrospirillum sp. BR 11828]MDZ5647699.1 glutathionylspermidine synthase family protein [Nitrospirillum sp. BR 11828]
MDRVSCTPRPDWTRRIEAQGLTYHSLGLPPGGGEEGLWWDESAAYAFTAAEIDHLEAATNTLHQLCLEAVAAIVATPALMDRFGLSPAYRAYVIDSWRRGDPSLYGRFDLAFNPEREEVAQPKMLEYNADTPTTLIESAVVQWFWLRDVTPDADQFNSIHERLIARWREIGRRQPPGALVHLSSYADYEEELRTVEYLVDTARQAGLNATHLPITQVGWDKGKRRFVDEQRRPLRLWFKLYPWEWLAVERFGAHLPTAGMTVGGLTVVEPPWKMLLSHKAILTVLWDLFPGHPNLLPAGFSAAAVGPDWIAKPMQAREGANIRLVRDGREVAHTSGGYGQGPLVYQRAVDLARDDGRHVVLGAWVVGDEAAGLCVREDAGPIITGASRFLPHYFR